MKTNIKVLKLAFVLAGKNRRDIFKVLLEGEKTASEISRLTNISISNVCRVLSEFKQRGLIENLTPTINRGRIYKITPHALDIENRFLSHIELFRRSE